MRYTFQFLGQHGRLGNQLWQMASTIGEARRNGGTWMFPQWRYAPHFNVPSGWFDYAGGQPGDIDPCRVHMQELRYIDNVAEELRQWFGPSPAMRVRLKEMYPWFWEIEHPVAIHVRRGDAIGKEMWHPIQPLSYHHTAMDMVREWVPNPTFVVFSDGINWCRQHLPDDCVFVSPEHIEHTQTLENAVDHAELLLMRECKDHIISNSTFSWWAAWLADNPRTIYPSEWFGVNYPELQARLHESLIVPGWEEVDVCASA